MIPLLVPRVPTAEQIYPYLLQIDENKVYSNNGPLNQLLIKRLSNYFEIPEENVATLSNATLALEGAIFTSPSKEFIWDLPAWTFTASPAAVLNAEREIRLLDVDLNWRVVPDSGTKNLLDVLPFGSPLDLNRLKGLNLGCLLVDAAASFDALKGIKLDTAYPAGVVVSMHATKMFSAGEGGIFISNDVEWVKRVKRWSNFGMGETRISLSRGTNAKLSEYAAAVANATLDIWPTIKAEYTQITQQVIELCGRLGLELFAPSHGHLTPYWVLRNLHPETKKEIKIKLSEHQIGHRDWWESGTAVMPAYSNFKSQNLVNTEAIANSSLGLPFHTSLTDRDLNTLEQILESIIIE